MQDPASQFTMTSGVFNAGARLYRAPELLDHEEIEEQDTLPKTPASDIYSFGCLCYEVPLTSSCKISVTDAWRAGTHAGA